MRLMVIFAFSLGNLGCQADDRWTSCPRSQWSPEQYHRDRDHANAGIRRWRPQKEPSGTPRPLWGSKLLPAIERWPNIGRFTAMH